MKIAFVLGLLFLLTDQGWSKPVEEDIDYEFQKDDYNDEYDDESLDANEDEDDTLPIEITTDAQHFTKPPLGQVELPCDVSGNRASIVLMWKKNDSIIFQDDHIFTTFDSKKFKLNGTWLIINDLEEKDSGDYVCMIIGGEGKVEVKHSLRVSSSRPQIISLTADKSTTNYTAGDKLELTCIATGDPEPKITWSLKGTRYGTGKTLLIENVGHENSGDYQCLAENSNGELDHKSIAIKIMHKPIVHLEKSTSNIENDKFDVVLRCSVRADPPAIVLWKKDGEEVKSNRRKNNHHILNLNAVDESKFGKYSCRADNQVGITEQFITISNKPSKALYQNGEQLNHGKNFNLTWEVESLYPISEYILEYKKKSDTEWKEEKPEVTNSGSENIYVINYMLKELDAGEYEVRVKSKNQHGWSEDSKITTFKAHKAHHGHKNHKNHHQSNPISQNEEDNNIALEARADGSNQSSSASLLLPSSTLLCVLLVSLFPRH